VDKEDCDRNEQHGGGSDGNNESEPSDDDDAQGDDDCANDDDDRKDDDKGNVAKKSEFAIGQKRSEEIEEEGVDFVTEDYGLGPDRGDGMAPVTIVDDEEDHKRPDALVNDGNLDADEETPSQTCLPVVSPYKVTSSSSDG
jgi:hypothetical protein